MATPQRQERGPSSCRCRAHMWPIMYASMYGVSATDRVLTCDLARVLAGSGSASRGRVGGGGGGGIEILLLLLQLLLRRLLLLLLSLNYRRQGQA